MISDPEEGRRSDIASVDSSVFELTTRMVSGDEEAFRLFHEHYFDRLYRYLIVVTGGNEQMALDGLQETLLRVVKYIRCFDRAEVFWSWLTVLARSAARDGARRQNSYLRMLTGYARGFLGLREADAIEPINAEAELRACVDAALAALEEMDQALIEGKYFEGKTVKDLAANTGLTVKSVESRLLRARRTIKEQVLILLDDERSV
ncbi:MAG: sigma-70 family RNA polymerase sigma factor [Verrucomicrobia bacterium]|nr:sigma-70 family RNA polymerase sigma factor [Verrucomicrobiota bacterium]